MGEVEKKPREKQSFGVVVGQRDAGYVVLPKSTTEKTVVERGLGIRTNKCLASWGCGVVMT